MVAATIVEECLVTVAAISGIEWVGDYGLYDGEIIQIDSEGDCVNIVLENCGYATAQNDLMVLLFQHVTRTSDLSSSPKFVLGVHELIEKGTDTRKFGVSAIDG